MNTDTVHYWARKERAAENEAEALVYRHMAVSAEAYEKMATVDR